MPKKRLDSLKRQMAYALINIDRAMEHVLGLRDQFLEVAGIDPEDPELRAAMESKAGQSQHARIALYLEGALVTALRVDEFIRLAAVDAYRTIPADLTAWTNPSTKYGGRGGQVGRPKGSKDKQPRKKKASDGTDV